MTTTARQLLEEFDHLAEGDKREVAAEILRRLLRIDRPPMSPMSDEELIFNTEAVFLELDDREQRNGGSEKR